MWYLTRALTADEYLYMLYYCIITYTKIEEGKYVSDVRRKIDER
jgi:hypothetical protein